MVDESGETLGTMELTEDGVVVRNNEGQVVGVLERPPDLSAGTEDSAQVGGGAVPDASTSLGLAAAYDGARILLRNPALWGAAGRVVMVYGAPGVVLGLVAIGVGYYLSSGESAQALPGARQAEDLTYVPRSDGNVEVVRDGEPIGVIGLPEGVSLDRISDEDLRRLSGPLIDPVPPRVDTTQPGFPDQRGENERPVVSDPVQEPNPGDNVETFPIQEPNPGDSIVTSNAENNERVARRQYEASNGMLANPDDLRAAGDDPIGGEWVYPNQPRSSGEGGTGAILPGYEYQEQVTNIPTGIEYWLGGKYFDSVDHERGVLIDAKDWNWEVYPTPVLERVAAPAIEDLRQQGQVAETVGYTVEVRVSNEFTARKINEFLDSNGVEGVRAVFIPKR